MIDNEQSDIFEGLEIPEDILKGMARICSGDASELLESLKSHYNLSRKEFGRAIFCAGTGPLVKQQAEYRKDKKAAKNELLKIKKTASNLLGLLQNASIPLCECVDSYFSAAYKHKRDSEYYLRKEKEWEDFESLVSHHITVFDEIIKAINNENKTGRSNYLKELEDFIYLLAKLYQAATQKKFTVDEYRENGHLVSLTEGMRFVEEAFSIVIPNKNPICYTAVWHTA